MNEILTNSQFFGLCLSLWTYFIGMWLKRKLKWAVLNPLLIAILLCIAVLLCFDIDYETYYQGARYISYFLTPATVALAIPLYEQLDQLKKNWKAILVGITSGVLASGGSILLLSKLFGFTEAEFVTFYPKPITTAIGMSLSEEMGGYVAITVAAIVITGVFGNIVAEAAVKLFGIKNRVAKGIAIGSASHAIGTVKAMEMGEVEGAMSSLSIVLSGILTVVLANLFLMLY